jgi:pyruvate/2-oxoglutarate dehydrogenase complex dihydrolipoamide acyltransferase (E2) component
MEHHPKFRSVLTEGHVLRTYHKTSIGLARALPNDELITAVVPNASDLSRDEYLAAARERLKHVDEQPSDDLKLATLVISYMGDFGIRDAVPVIVPPACATLFVGSANLEPVADEKGQRIERFATVSLTFDHRIANGVGAARFLTELKDMVENFDLD